jgi:hypothetical protein
MGKHLWRMDGYGIICRMQGMQCSSQRQKSQGARSVARKIEKEENERKSTQTK